MNITRMEIKELKAMAYDVVISIQKLQNDLMALNNEIAKKSRPKIPEIKPKKKEKKK